MSSTASGARPGRSRTPESSILIETDFASLQAHMARCEVARGRLHGARDWLERVRSFAAARLVTSSVIVGLIVAIIASIASRI